MKKILIIEDESVMLRNLTTLLQLEGFQAVGAPDGNAGVRLAQQTAPDLILCDISMPGMNGYEVLAALRGAQQTSGIPFIFLTARGEKGDVRGGMNLGADDYLVKPVARADLLSAIEARLRRATQQQAQSAPPTPATLSPAMLLPLGLTAREAETLYWVAQGKSNAEVGLLLSVRLPTVKKHLENIFQKLGVENRTSAAAVAMARLTSSPGTSGPSV